MNTACIFSHLAPRRMNAPLIPPATLPRRQKRQKKRISRSFSFGGRFSPLLKYIVVCVCSETACSGRLVFGIYCGPRCSQRVRAVASLPSHDGKSFGAGDHTCDRFSLSYNRIPCLYSFLPTALGACLETRQSQKCSCSRRYFCLTFRRPTPIF